MRSSKDIEDTVNIAEPVPPMPRRKISCSKVWENPAKALESETILSPIQRTLRSPNLLTNQPLGAALTNRIKAKTLITELAAKAETSKVWAKTGMIGATIPNPRATQNATAVRTATSPGRSLKYRSSNLRIFSSKSQFQNHLQQSEPRSDRGVQSPEFQVQVQHQLH